MLTRRARRRQTLNQLATLPENQLTEADQIRTMALSSPGAYAHYASAGEWRRARHLDLLNRYIVEAATGRIFILIVSVPPRYGKSELISRYTPAWFLSVYPNKNVILTSYEADFASRVGLQSEVAL